jgi:hypothetical protein
MQLAVIHITSLELNRYVLDSEEPHRIMDVLEDVLMTLGLTHYRVRAHRHYPRAHSPNVQVVH